jgi:hypothetical protein
MNATPTMAIADIAYHRNGVCGEPFFVVLFTEAIEPTEVDPTIPAAVRQAFGWDRPQPASRQVWRFSRSPDFAQDPGHHRCRDRARRP